MFRFFPSTKDIEEEREYAKPIETRVLGYAVSAHLAILREEKEEEEDQKAARMFDEFEQYANPATMIALLPNPATMILLTTTTPSGVL